MNKKFLLLFLILLFSTKVFSQTDTIYVYGPGGPYPAMKAVAEAFENKYKDVKVILIKGPLNNWKEEAKEKADLIYSGSEDMMGDFMNVFSEQIDGLIKPLYFRPSGLIVRKGNPKNIHSLDDLKREDINILVVNGAGLRGVWEDILGNMRNRQAFGKIRNNIVVFAINSGAAEKSWKEDPTIDVWISWNIWQIANADTADFVRLDDKFTVYRNCGVFLTKKGSSSGYAKRFDEFLTSKEAEKIFRSLGWE